jgi:hypothetical protein
MPTTEHARKTLESLATQPNDIVRCAIARKELELGVFVPRQQLRDSTGKPCVPRKGPVLRPRKLNPANGRRHQKSADCDSTSKKRKYTKGITHWLHPGSKALLVTETSYRTVTCASSQPLWHCYAAKI